MQYSTAFRLERHIPKTKSVVLSWFLILHKRVLIRIIWSNWYRATYVRGRRDIICCYCSSAITATEVVVFFRIIIFVRSTGRWNTITIEDRKTMNRMLTSIIREIPKRKELGKIWGWRQSKLTSQYTMIPSEHSYYCNHKKLRNPTQWCVWRNIDQH